MPAVSTFSDQIRNAIQTCGISRYEIAMRTGVAQSVLSRFIQGHRGLTTDTLDQLAVELELKVETRTENKTRSGNAGMRGVFVSVEKGTVANGRKRLPKKLRKISRL